jgi:DNA-binding transcriptional MerR regulator
MRIGELAAEAGVNLQTIRFYERRGLLREPPRLMSGYRSYTPQAVRTIRFIKGCQALGFTLSEIAELLHARDSISVDAISVRTMAEAKVRDINERIKGLQNMRDELSSLLSRCTCGTGEAACPALEAIGQPKAVEIRPTRSRSAALFTDE